MIRMCLRKESINILQIAWHSSYADMAIPEI